MKNSVKSTAVNQLLKNLVNKNLMVVGKPLFHWNGITVTDDETAPIKQVSNYKLTENYTLSNFLTTHQNKTIVLLATDDNLINNGILRAFIV